MSKTTPYTTMNILLFQDQEIFRQESIQEELELVESQKRDLAKLLEDVDEKRRAYVKEIGQKPVSPSQAIEIEQFQDQIQDRLEELLLPFQAKRLGEINQYLLLQQLGIAEFIEVQAREMRVRVNSRNLAQKVKNQSNSVSLKSKELAKEFIDEILPYLMTANAS